VVIKMTDAKAHKRRGPRGEYAKSSVTRELILDAALEVFAESGYRSGSLRDIAARVGMSDAGLLHHFPSKSALLGAVLDRRDFLARTIVPTEGTGGISLLRALVDLSRHNASVPGVVELYCILSAEGTAPDHPAHAYFTSRYDGVRALVGDAFEAIRAEGRLLAGVSPQRAAIATIALMDGLQVQWLLDRDVVDMAAELSDFFGELVDGWTTD
jgi:AcrR family transcriptional regulator